MLSIVHNHADWVVVNKPAGISMQQEQGEPNSLSLLQLSLAAVQNIDLSTTRLWPVHRLDKATSGLVIFAKSAAAAAQFGELFSTQQISKLYLAIALGKPKKKQGWVKGDMEKGRNGSWLLTRSQNNPAITYFNSCAIQTDISNIDNPSIPNNNPSKRLYLVTPKTGKTHQIRVALKSLGCAILGDERYKGAVDNRCYLHAFRVVFNWQGIEHQFQCEPAQGNWPDFKQIEMLNEFFL